MKDIKNFYERIIFDLANQFPRFKYFLFNNSLYNDVSSIVSNFVNEDFFNYLLNNYNATFHYGCFRFCIVVNDNYGLEWVLKSSYDYDDYYNFDGEEMCDCCAIEQYFYEKAKETGVEKFFAEIQNIGKFWIDGEYTNDFYIAKRFDVNTEELYNGKYRDYQDYRNEYASYEYFEDLFEYYEIPCAFAKIYDDCWYDVEKLADFLRKYNIHDLHDENVGFDKDGKIAIIDYSMF